MTERARRAPRTSNAAVSGAALLLLSALLLLVGSPQPASALTTVEFIRQSHEVMALASNDCPSRLSRCSENEVLVDPEIDPQQSILSRRLTARVFNAPGTSNASADALSSLTIDERRPESRDITLRTDIGFRAASGSGLPASLVAFAQTSAAMTFTVPAAFPGHESALAVSLSTREGDRISTTFDVSFLVRDVLSGDTIASFGNEGGQLDLSTDLLEGRPLRLVYSANVRGSAPRVFDPPPARFSTESTVRANLRFTQTLIPEPATSALLGLGLLALAGRRRPTAQRAASTRRRS